MKKWAFIMAVIISMLCFGTAGAAGKFADIPDGYWAKDEIEAFASRGIVNGVNGNFLPEDGLTREQFCKMLVLTFDSPLETPDTPSFSDLNEDRWSYPYVESCKSFLTGYINPFGGLPAFHPEELATREDIAVALVRMMGLSDTDVVDKNYALRKFADGDKISPGVLSYVSLACERGLITGYPDGTFGPARSITRAEAVVLLNRAMKQAVSSMDTELDMTARIVYSSDGATATIHISAEEGTAVTVNDETVDMTSSGGRYEGAYIYKFKKDGEKRFEITGRKMGREKTLELSAEYMASAPTLDITVCPSSTTDSKVTVSGKVKDALGYVELRINGKSVEVSPDGSWKGVVTLKLGKNELEFVAENGAGKVTKKTREIERYEAEPELKIIYCPEVTTEKTVTISGSFSGGNGFTLMINGSQVYVSNQLWSQTVSLKEGKNEFLFVAKGGDIQIKRTITCISNPNPPEIRFTNCPASTQQKKLKIEGTVKDENGSVKLYLDDEPVSLNRRGEFSVSVNLKPGDNVFKFRAVNEFDKSTTVKKTVTFVEEEDLDEDLDSEVESLDDETDGYISL